MPKRKTKPDRPALDRFEQSMDARGYQTWDENRIQEVIRVQGGKRPDFLTRTTDSGDFLAEIESFEKESFSLISLRQYPVRSGLSAFDIKRIGRALRRGADQLEPYTVTAIPLVVVLDDFRMIGIPQNNDYLGLALSDFFPARPFVSAAAWMTGVESSSSSGIRFRVFHNPSASFPLAVEIFQDPCDEHWRQNPGEFWKRSQ